MDSLFIDLLGTSSLGAYAAIFGVLLVCGLGVPLPEDIPLVAAGYLSWRGTMDPTLAFLTTMAGVLVGDTLLFFLGRRLGRAMLSSAFVVGILPPKKQRRIRAYSRKFGDRVVFFARFLAGIRGAAFFMAGATGMPYRRFILMDALAALVSVPVWLLLGYLLGVWIGNEVEEVIAAMDRFRHAVLVGVVVLLAALMARPLYRIVRAARRAKNDTASA